MKPNARIETDSFIKMIEAEKRAERYRYHFEVSEPLSRVCESADALGPLILKEKFGRFGWKLSGDFFYSRFRMGDRVELRTRSQKGDRSEHLSYDWIVQNVTYPSPGKIELLITPEKPQELDQNNEIFLFRGLATGFNSLLIKKLYEIGKEAVILGSDQYNLETKALNFISLYDKLNKVQRTAVEYLISNNLMGAVQGPPGTGKTQLLKAVVTLALESNMKVCVASFTNAAVDNLLGRLVDPSLNHDWVRVGDPSRVNRDLYDETLRDLNFISQKFSPKSMNAALLDPLCTSSHLINQHQMLIC